MAPASSTLSYPFVIDVKDQFANGIQGVQVTWTTDGGTLSATVTITDKAGQTQTKLTLPAIAGDVSVTAHVTGLTDAIFIATAR